MRDGVGAGNGFHLVDGIVPVRQELSERTAWTGGDPWIWCFPNADVGKLDLDAEVSFIHGGDRIENGGKIIQSRFGAGKLGA